MHYFYSILLGLLNAFLCAHFAKKRGRNPVYWFIGGALFGLFALGTLFVLPVRRSMAAAPVASAAAPVPLLQVIEPVLADRLWYYLDHERQQCGPMSFDALGKAWNEGKLHVHSLVWNDGLENWKRFEEVVTGFKKN